ncbi:MAG: alginate O-acetyltransferase AlgX-related protein [Chthoniobacterales bacterium]
MRALKRERELPVGHDEPRTPTHSLPSYKEPTPETNRRLTREDEAEIALKRTVFTQGTPQALITLFLITILSVPLIQFARGPSPLRALPRLDQLWHGEDLKSAEKTLEAESVVSQWLLPRAQSILIGKLRAANEQVFLGRDGWLFYRPDVEYVTGAPFLAPAQLQRRTHAARIQPDPVKAIVQFRDQLAARGIDLVVLPIPTKATIQGEKLSARVLPNESLQNASFTEFQNKLTAASVRLFDPTTALMQRKSAPVYLDTDTHWRPVTMQFVAQNLAASLNLPPSPNNASLQVSEKEVEAVGDISRMLKLPNETSQKVTIQQVTNGNSLWRPSRDADVLLLGDSFSNTFSLEALGWGESAGFAEHLSVAFGGRPLDCILRNSDGAFATREMLANELARGRDRLAGKTLVIWEFAARELAFGNWKLIELKLGTPVPSRFFSPGRGEEVEVSGMVEAVSSVPRPGSVPYADHIMSVKLADVQLPNHKGEAVQAIVYLQSMHDNIWTPAARLRVGDHVKIRLRAWSDFAAQYEQINRSELDDPELQLEEPAWGELVR